jgi:D-3-phosphoglycerate dehydrogenase
MPKILITARSFTKSEKALSLLKKENYEVVCNPFDKPLKENELIELVNGVDAIIAGVDEITERVIEKASPTLKIIARHGVGVNNVNLSAAKKYGIVVTNTPRANSIAVAELTIALMLALVRHLTVVNAKVRENNWQRIMGIELNDKTLGIIGLGNIGCEVVKRLSAFNMRILAYDKYEKSEMREKYKVTYVALDKLLEESDVVSLHLNVTDETKGMINKKKLAKMKTNAILINTARGELIVERDLYDALKNNRIAAAALDAFENEPLYDSPFFELENVILTSHIGAYTVESIDRMATMAALEVISVLDGKPAENPVI